MPRSHRQKGAMRLNRAWNMDRLLSVQQRIRRGLQGDNAPQIAHHPPPAAPAARKAGATTRFDGMS